MVSMHCLGASLSRLLICAESYTTHEAGRLGICRKDSAFDRNYSVGVVRCQKDRIVTVLSLIEFIHEASTESTSGSSEARF